MSESPQKNELFENLCAVLQHLDSKVNTATLVLLMTQINMMGIINALPEAYKFGQTQTPKSSANISEALPMLLPLLSNMKQPNKNDKKRR